MAVWDWRQLNGRCLTKIIKILTLINERILQEYNLYNINISKTLYNIDINYMD